MTTDEAEVAVQLIEARIEAGRRLRLAAINYGHVCNVEARDELYRSAKIYTKACRMVDKFLSTWHVRKEEGGHGR